MSSSDKFWLVVWGTVATIGFIIVIIGVTIEGVEHFKKFPRKEHARKLQIEKFGWFLVVAGLAMEFLGDHAAKRISDREDARVNKEAADAREAAGVAERAAGQANERAANTESNNLMLSASVEKLSSENMELGLRLRSVNAAIPPRNISETQREKIIFVLSSEANKSPKIDVKVFVGDTNQEADNYARQFRIMLNDAGYGTNREEIIRIPFEGVSTADGTVKTVPDVIAIFSSPTAEIPQATMAGGFGSILMMRPTKTVIAGGGGQIDDKGAMYRYTENPNDILYGITSVLRQYEITVGPMSGYYFIRREIMKPGEIGFFISAKIY